MRDFQTPGRSQVIAANGVCATSHPLAAQAAVQVLQAGGNAVDAAIAGAVLLGIAEPQATGIGGDCFVLLKPAGEERIIALNGSGRAPSGLNAADLRAQGLSAIPPESVHSVTLPGAVDAFCKLSADWGKLGLADSLAPAIRYADEGVPVAERVSYDWAEYGPRLSGAARISYLVNGQIPNAGQMFHAKGQAEVLRRIAREGRAGFYEGEVAEDMLASLNALGGTHRAEDFAATSCDYTSPIAGAYRDHELVEHPPNGQGATAILLLNILSNFDMSGMDPFGAARTHLEAEATKLAYDARNRFIADPAHTTRLEHLLSPDTASRLAALIDPKRVLDMGKRPANAVHRDTVYITVVDRDLQAVSLIYSIFWPFGSGLASDKFGILFQNRGAGFSLEEGHPNEVAPGKRPMHTIIPGMLRKDGRLIMPFGVMGGQYQSTGHARLITDKLVFGMDSQTAINGPRAFAEAGELRLERGYSDAVRTELSALGHNVVPNPGPMGGAQSIDIDYENGVLIGSSDPRKDGCAIGY